MLRGGQFYSAPEVAQKHRLIEELKLAFYGVIGTLRKKGNHGVAGHIAKIIGDFDLEVDCQLAHLKPHSDSYCTLFKYVSSFEEQELRDRLQRKVLKWLDRKKDYKGTATALTLWDRKEEAIPYFIKAGNMEDAVKTAVEVGFLDQAYHLAMGMEDYYQASSIAPKAGRVREMVEELENKGEISYAWEIACENGLSKQAERLGKVLIDKEGTDTYCPFGGLVDVAKSMHDSDKVLLYTRINRLTRS